MLGFSVGGGSYNIGVLVCGRGVIVVLGGCWGGICLNGGLEFGMIVLW